MEIRYQDVFLSRETPRELTRALGTMLAIFLQFPQVRVHEERKDPTKEVKRRAILQASRQPAHAGRARRLRDVRLTLRAGLVIKLFATLFPENL
jgi:hypothetical protein